MKEEKTSGDHVACVKRNKRVIRFSNGAQALLRTSMHKPLTVIEKPIVPA
jgi:hypothetical protein